MHHINTAEAANETRGRLQLVGGSETETDLSWQSAPNTLHDTHTYTSLGWTTASGGPSRFCSAVLSPVWEEEAEPDHDGGREVTGA